jgi:hypothetical protein
MSALMMLCAVTMAVGASPEVVPPPTWAEISLAIWFRYGAAVATSIAATWMLLSAYEKRQDARHTEMKDSLGKVAAALASHDTNPFAHGPASEHNHGPMNAQMDRIEAQGEATAKLLNDLIRDHNRIQEEESAICSALAELRKRDPADSPKPRRAGDSGTDYTPLRGRG